ncbi:hypothetical protein N1851_003582 [Merluccius polli]|uniref:Uncharacterized protein n=1 Tax=Merluccius polli TaxID=89951 RepID=A0AA47N8H8_MERPO|nr:hypothetical protein N1851_003582 [Merluccius polli]
MVNPALLRTTLADDLLSHLGNLSVESRRACSLNMDEFVKHFASSHKNVSVHMQNSEHMRHTCVVGDERRAASYLGSVSSASARTLPQTLTLERLCTTMATMMVSRPRPMKMYCVYSITAGNTTRLVWKLVRMGPSMYPL